MKAQIIIEVETESPMAIRHEIPYIKDAIVDFIETHKLGEVGDVFVVVEVK